MGGLFQNSTFTTTPQVFYNTIPDVDAQAFITAANITNGIQKIAIYRLVTDLKGYGIWTKMKAIYPIVGGTAASHKWNLKNPLDTNAAFRLGFSTGWTHSSLGMTPTNAYANTYLNPLSILSQNSINLSYYSRTNIGGNADIGLDTWTSPYTYGYIKTTGNTSNSRLNTGNSEVSNATTNSLGLFSFNRNSSTVISIYKNGVPNNLNQTSTGLSNGSVLIGGMWTGAALEYGNKQCAFASIGDGLTDTEAANFYTAVQRYQILLNRQV